MATFFYTLPPLTLPLFFKSKGRFTMAEFLRNLYLCDHLVNGEPINEVCVTEKVKDIELSFIVDVGLSNPHNKRYSTLFKNGMNVKQLFDDMTSNLDAGQWVGLSNGTKTSYQTVKVWSKNFDWNLSTWITDDKSVEQNVIIKVDGKNLKKVDAVAEVSKL